MDDVSSQLQAPASMLHQRQEQQEYRLPSDSVIPHGRGRGRGGRSRGRGRGGHYGGRDIVHPRETPANGDANPQQQQQQQQTKPHRPRLQRPKVHMMPRTLADLLDEPKIALMHRVVKLAGPDTAWTALMETLTIEEHGGLEVNADACGRPPHMMLSVHQQQQQQQQPRRRTKGGVFLSMLKTHVSKEIYKSIFEVEAELKKKRKKQMRHVKYQKMESKINGLPMMELTISGVQVGGTPVGAETLLKPREVKVEAEAEEGEIDEHDVTMADG